jgi:aryl-alcohol dehydrogenase-like predicted oxidoreductase
MTMHMRPSLNGLVVEAPQISELGFGCAAIAGRVSRNDSLLALNFAYDAGITLYDTARSYGYGQSEAVVGEFLQGRRESIVLCTKFGIMPRDAGGWKQRIKPVAQLATRAFPGLRKIAQRQAGDQLVATQFTPENLRSSFETSLRELKTDYVDLLLLHAAPVTVLQQEDLLEAIERLVQKGQIRMAGISADLQVIEKYFAKRPKQLMTAQFALNLANIAFAEKVRQNSDLLLVGNHPFGGPGGAAAGRAVLAELRVSPELPTELREKLDPDDPQTLPELVLNCVLRGTGISAVVPAMMQVRHIQSNVRALAHCRFTIDELTVLQEHFAVQMAAASAD